jgi:hypothetical protein
MSRFWRSMSIGLLIGLLSASNVLSQERVITERDLQNYLAVARTAAGDAPYRRRETIEMAEKATGPWRTDGSSIKEVVPPYSSHQTFSKPGTPVTIQIGNTFYSKLPGYSWSKTATEFHVIAPQPAASPRFPAAGVTYTATNGDGNTFAVSVIIASASEVGNDAKKVRLAIYKLDQRGLLLEMSSTDFRDGQWVRYTFKYEYDPKITIVAPINLRNGKARKALGSQRVSREPKGVRPTLLRFSGVARD